jgi:rod shape-determining protein MreC
VVVNREPRRQRTYFILLLVTAFALMTIDYHSNGASSPLHPLESAVASVVGPGEDAVTSLVRPITDEVHFGKQPDTVAALQKQLDAAKRQAELSQEDHSLAEQLRGLMGWPAVYENKMLPARVVGGGDALSGSSSVTIEAGTRDGLHINMTVVTGDGLIGNVYSVSKTTATVQLLIDPSIHVTTLNERSRVTGWVQGLPDGNLQLTQISQTSDIRVNDKLVTKGSVDNQPYVQDVPVGTVISVQNTPGAATHTAVVKPFASFDKLDLVAVIFPPTAPLHQRLYIGQITPGPTTAPPTPPVTPGPPSGSANPSSSGAPGTSAGTTSAAVTSAVHTTAASTTTPAHTTPPPPTTPTTTHKPPTSKPPTSKPATSKPATSKPATSKPTTHKPTKTSRPTTKPPVTTTTANPTTTAPPPATPTP